MDYGNFGIKRMDKTEAINIANKYISFVSKKYLIENAILFGSYASGKNDKNSDIDIAIVFNNIDDIFELQVDLMKLRNDNELLIEPHPFLNSDFSKENPFVSKILKNGIKLNVNQKNSIN